MILVNRSLHIKPKKKEVYKKLLINFLKQIKHCFGQAKQYFTIQDM